MCRGGPRRGRFFAAVPLRGINGRRLFLPLWGTGGVRSAGRVRLSDHPPQGDALCRFLVCCCNFEREGALLKGPFSFLRPVPLRGINGPRAFLRSKFQSAISAFPRKARSRFARSAGPLGLGRFENLTAGQGGHASLSANSLAVPSANPPRRGFRGLWGRDAEHRPRSWARHRPGPLRLGRSSERVSACSAAVVAPAAASPGLAGRYRGPGARQGVILPSGRTGGRGQPVDLLLQAV